MISTGPDRLVTPTAGEVQVMVPFELTTNDAAVPPNVTPVAPASQEPDTTTLVPPVIGPVAAEIPVITGGGVTTVKRSADVITDDTPDPDSSVIS